VKLYCIVARLPSKSDKCASDHDKTFEKMDDALAVTRQHPKDECYCVIEKQEDFID
jgi:hypothetical protein